MPKVDFSKYDSKNFYDEMFDEAGEVRSHYKAFKKHLAKMGTKRLSYLQHSTDRTQFTMGMTFNVYSDDEGAERILHLDIIPRIVTSAEWNFISKGLEQRVIAMNMFIDDIYNEQKIIKDKIVPEDIILSCEAYSKHCIGLKPPEDIWCHISGIDIIRGNDGNFYILEDNLRCPSGVSYMLENREILKNIFPKLFKNLRVRPVSNYPLALREMLDDFGPNVAVLTPGMYNSAYYEHSYLAHHMGVELVEGRDLIVKDDHVYMKTTKGLQKIQVLYRRVDDDFIDPLVFNKDSLLGVPGLFNAYKKGNITLVNAPGTGVADDKAIYAYVPKIIKYYLDEEIILPNVHTYLCYEKKDQEYVFQNIEKLVVKQTNSSGGYGMMIGPKASKEEHKLFKEKIKANPRNFIAQPTINLSTMPTVVNTNKISSRHIDLRPFVLYGKEIKIIPGGLTRVALKEGSLVVNSSQGGGSKDTWVINKF